MASPSEKEVELCCPTEGPNPPHKGHPTPAGSPLRRPESRTVGRRTLHDWSRVQRDPSDQVVLTALGPLPAVRPGLRILPAADCFPVGISASRDQARVNSVGQYNLLSFLFGELAVPGRESNKI